MRWTATRAPAAEDETLWRVVSDGVTVDVRVDPGPALLRRLERAVSERLGVPTLAPPIPARYRIDESTHSHGDLYELEVDTIWTVVDATTETRLWQFRGGTSHELAGGAWSAATGGHGCDEVELGADGLHVLARDSNEVKCHPMPDL